MTRDTPTSRELFNKLMEVMDKQTEIQQQTASAMTKLGEQVEQNTKTIKSKFWYILLAALAISAWSIGLKLWPYG